MTLYLTCTFDDHIDARVLDHERIYNTAKSCWLIHLAGKVAIIT